MSLMFGWIKNLFKKPEKPRKQALATGQFYWHNGDTRNRTFTAVCTFYVDQFGTRSIEIDKAEDRHNIYDVETHPWYIAYVIPFLRKTGYFDESLSTYQLKSQLYALCYREEVPQKVPVQRPPKEEKPRPKSQGNVIEFPNKANK